MLLCKQEESGIQLNAEQADWKDDTDDESDDQELEAHYMYVAKIQEVSPDVVDSGPIIDTEPEQKLKEANNKLSEENDLLYADFKKSQAKLKRRDSIEYASEMELECAKKEAQIKLYKTREDKELKKVIELENKVKKAKRANPRLYDIGCYYDNLALMFAPESDEVIRLEKESRSKLSDLIKPFDYTKLNSLYDLFVPQREKSSEQRYFSERSRMSHINVQKEKRKEYFHKQTTLLEKRMDESIPRLNEEMVVDLRYFYSLELEIDSLTSQLETQKTHFVNEIDRLSREYYYADHMNAILGVSKGPKELDEVTNLQCDYLELLQKCDYLEIELSKSKIMSKSFESVQKHAINLELELQQCKEKIKNDMSFKVNKSKDFCKEREQYFEIQDLKAQLQDKGIVISELKKLIEKLKGKSVDTKFEKSSVIRQPNAFKSQRPSVLGKPTTFSNSFIRKDFSKSTSVTQNNVSNDFSKPVTAQTLPSNKKPCLKNTNVLAHGMYKLYTDHTRTRTSQLPQDSKKTNKRVSFSTGVIPTTSVNRPQLKSNPQGNRFMHNNSQGKKKEVEDHRRSVKLSKNKTSVTACNDSLNAKTLNVKFVSAMCDKCVLINKHDMCVLKSVDKPIKKTVALESNKKPRNLTRKLYERVSKTCSWWYPKFTPSGYIWKPKSRKENVNPNVRVIPTTSVSRPQLKSSPKGDRVLRSNSGEKKLEVEEPRRNVMSSKNKMPVTACTANLNVKTVNVKSVSAMCAKCVMIKKHDLRVPKYVAKPLRKIVASDTIKKPRNNVQKLNERFGKTYKWTYIKFTPSGYMWKPKSKQANVNPNVS
nr:hypothetical protein [Tanacetum cinerariifolium]